MYYKYKVYLFIFPNGKKYCGYTSQENINNRWHGGHGYEKCPLVWKAIQKYGWKNIEKKIIYSSPNMEDALQKEKEIIAYYNLTNPIYGYNLDQGGKSTGNSQFLTIKGRKKISETHKKLWSNPDYRKKMSDIQKNIPHRPLSEETKRKISESKKGSIPPNRIAVVQIDKNTNAIIASYESATAAALALNIERTGCSNILNACKGKRKTAYGYKWSFKNE